MATTIAPSSSTLPMIQINAHNQLPLKLNNSNFPTWYLQIETLLTGLDIIGFIDGTISCPAKIIAEDESKPIETKPNPTYSLWVRQDKLILHALLSFLSEAVVPTITRATSSRDAMTMLVNIFSGKTKSRIITLKKKLSLLNQENSIVDEYLQTIRSIADELAIAQSLESTDDLNFIILNGLHPKFNVIATALRVRETNISYEEIHEKLNEHETLLKRQETATINTISVNNVQRRRNNNAHPNQNQNYRGNYKGNNFDPNFRANMNRKQANSTPNNNEVTSNGDRPTCQLCGKIGHIANRCWNFTILNNKEQSANMV